MASSFRPARRQTIGVLLLFTLASIAGCGGGKKRPSALTGGPPPAPAAPPTTAPEPAEPGPDVDRLTDEGALEGTDMSTAAEALTEGGPLEDVTFIFDSSALTDAARATLSRHAAWLQAHPSASVTVEGHCDERGTVDYNLALGEQRARAALEYLVGLGVPSGRLRPVSFGKEKPVDPASNEAAWAKNRRAHFVVTGG
jgi:peptidoglycan-associated lipoprotein